MVSILLFKLQPTIDLLTMESQHQVKRNNETIVYKKKTCKTQFKQY
jgi:hypothetical protein